MGGKYLLPVVTGGGEDGGGFFFFTSTFCLKETRRGLAGFGAGLSLGFSLLDDGPGSSFLFNAFLTSEIISNLFMKIRKEKYQPFR